MHFAMGGTGAIIASLLRQLAWLRFHNRTEGISNLCLVSAGTHPGALCAAKSFLGQEIVCKPPVFDPVCATLMDFFIDDSGRIVFAYVLPFSSTRALIELTIFAKAPVKSAELSAPLQEQIRARKRTRRHAHAVVRAGQGILLMGLGLKTEAMQARHLQVGLMHGGARASTGYAFQRIQRWAKEGAAQFVTGTPMAGHRADPLVTRDLLSIVTALPVQPFIRQIGRGLRSAG